MEDEQGDDGKVTYSLTISRDRDGFLRQTCPSCGRDFKTETVDADVTSVLQPQIQRIGLDYGVSLSVGEEEVSASTLTCPYCEHTAETSDFVAEETLTYLKRFVYREVLTPILNRAFGDLADSFGSNRRSGGMFSISIEFQHHRSVLSQRPIHGPEPADMKIISLLCCGKKIKVAESWQQINICSYCLTPVIII